MANEDLDQDHQLTQQFDIALLWASELHRTQGRKAYLGPSRVPYLAHLLSVAGSVLEAGGDETAAIGALLHDAVEDQNVAFEEIEHRTSSDVAKIVKACTDTGDTGIARTRENSFARKVAYLAHVREGRDLRGRALLVAIADKLQNVRGLVADYVSGEDVWKKFNITNPLINLSFYSQLDYGLNRLVPEGDAPAVRLGQELHRAVTELLTVAGNPGQPVLNGAWERAKEQYLPASSP